MRTLISRSSRLAFATLFAVSGAFAAEYSTPLRRALPLNRAANSAPRLPASMAPASLRLPARFSSPARLAANGPASAALMSLSGGVDDGKTFDGGNGGSGGALPVGAKSLDEEKTYWIQVEARTKEQRTLANESGIDIEQVGETTIGGFSTPSGIRRLQEKGFTIQSRQELPEVAVPLQFPGGDKAFRDYEQVQGKLRELAGAAPGLTSLVEVGKTFEKRSITAIRFNSTAKGMQASGKPGILFIGTHHAREHLSTEVPLLLAEWLVKNRDSARVKELLAKRDIFIVPLLNADGSEYDHATGKYRWHRKNMRDPEGRNGIDLNRNYGYHWGTGGASADPSNDTYRGPEAFSEPETQAVRDFVNAHSNLKVLLSYHTFSELILYPYGHTYDPIGSTQEDKKDPNSARALAAYKAMAEKMAAMNGYKPEQSSQLYIASGDTTDWAWGVKRIFAFTFELTPKSIFQGGFYPGAAAIQPTFEKNLEPALYLIDIADDPLRAAPPNAS